MKLRLVAVGKLHSKEIENLVAGYSRKIPHYMPFELTVIPDVKGGKGTDLRRQKSLEGAQILQVLGPGDRLVLLDERGRELTSRQLADYIRQRCHDVSRTLTLVIGGPYGFSDDVYRAAADKLSLSRLTLPHELARLLTIEQLYRALTILAGEPYHHD